VGLFLVVQLGALALVPEFAESGYQAVDNPDNPTNSLLYIAAIIAMTGLMLAAFRYDLDQGIRLLIVGVSAWLSWYVFSAVVSQLAAAAVPAIAVGVALLVYPEWYVIDTAGLMGAGAARGAVRHLVRAVACPPAVGFPGGVRRDLGVRHRAHAVARGGRDGPEHPRGARDSAVAFVLASGERSESEGDDTDGDSAIDDGDPDANSDDLDNPDESADEGADVSEPTDIEDRDAFFIGLGDAVIPTVLVASAATFSPAAAPDMPLIGINLPALLAVGIAGLVGSLAGLLVLMSWVIKGRPHAGLPLLNGGAIGGYLIGSAPSSPGSR